MKSFLPLYLCAVSGFRQIGGSVRIGKFSFSKMMLLESLVFVILYALLLLSYFDRVFDKGCGVMDGEVIYLMLTFSVYVGASMTINYILTPRFFNKKLYLSFVVSIIFLLLVVVLIEEFVLEQIFWPDSRGDYFSGFFSTIVEFGAYILIPVGVMFVLNTIRKDREMEQLKSFVKESELERLRSQINPHFLFNNLNNLYALSLEQSPKTPEMILRLSNIMRYVLEEGNGNYIDLELEVNHLKDYVALSELQIEGRGVIYFRCEGDLRGKKIAPNLLSVFIENAFKHSSSGIPKGIEIDIQVKVEASVVKFSIQNNFAVRNEGAPIGHGIGLKNVEQRLRLLYPNKHDLQVREKEGIYEVFLTVEV